MNINSRMNKIEAAIVSGRLRNCPECGNPPPQRPATTSASLTPRQESAAKSLARLTDHLQQSEKLHACPVCGVWNLREVPDDDLHEMHRLLLIVEDEPTPHSIKTADDHDAG